MAYLFSIRLFLLSMLLQYASIVTAESYPQSIYPQANDCRQVSQFCNIFSSVILPLTSFSMNAQNKNLTDDDFCKGLKKIIKESGTAYKDVRFNKKEDEDWEGRFNYDTKLPKLGFEYIGILEEKAMKNVKGIKTIYSCMLSSDDINNRTAAETKYKETIAAVTGCVSKTGEAEKSDDKLQWYTVEMEENGQLKKIRIMLTHYSSSSSLSLEISYYSKE